MDVVNADVRREPAQDTRQVIVGTAMQRGFVKTPGLRAARDVRLQSITSISPPMFNFEHRLISVEQVSQSGGLHA